VVWRRGCASARAAGTRRVDAWRTEGIFRPTVRVSLQVRIANGGMVDDAEVAT
jgi:hypothetical protein